MYELNFSLLVEQMLSLIVDPAYRQMMVETFMVVSTILRRNPEFTFGQPVQMDKVQYLLIYIMMCFPKETYPRYIDLFGLIQLLDRIFFFQNLPRSRFLVIFGRKRSLSYN